MHVYSHSQLSIFENCALRYRFRYVDKIEKPDDQTIEAFLGKRVHETMQRLYEDLRIGQSRPLDEILDLYRISWRSQWSPQIRIVRRSSTADDYMLYGESCIRNYYERYAPFGQSETLATEHHFQIPFDDKGRFSIEGYIDRVAQGSDGRYEIHDYKTSQRLPSQQAVDSDRQLGLYQIALQTEHPEVDRVDLYWHFMGHSVTLHSTRQPTQLVELRTSTTRLIQKIEREKNFRAHKSPLCDWCEYRPECPAWRSSRGSTRRPWYTAAPRRRKKHRGIVSSLLDWLKKPL
jgi:putative RecB family exonuclease